METQPHPCWNEDCIGYLRPKVIDFKLGNITVPNVPCFQCDDCGEQVFAKEGSAVIEAFLATLPE